MPKDSAVSFIGGPSAQLYRISPDGNAMSLIAPSIGSIGDYAWSPDGFTLAALVRDTSYNSRLYVVDMQSGQKRLIAEYRSISSFCWSPDSRNVAYIAGDIAGPLKFNVVDRSSIGSKPVTDVITKPVNTPAWLDYNRILFYAPTGLAVVNLESGDKRSVSTVSEFNAFAIPGTHCSQMFYLLPEDYRGKLTLATIDELILNAGDDATYLRFAAS